MYTLSSNRIYGSKLLEMHSQRVILYGREITDERDTMQYGLHDYERAIYRLIEDYEKRKRRKEIQDFFYKYTLF